MGAEERIHLAEPVGEFCAVQAGDFVAAGFLHRTAQEIVGRRKAPRLAVVEHGFLVTHNRQHGEQHALRVVQFQRLQHESASLGIEFLDVVRRVGIWQKDAVALMVLVAVVEGKLKVHRCRGVEADGECRHQRGDIVVDISTFVSRGVDFGEGSGLNNRGDLVVDHLEVVERRVIGETQKMQSGRGEADQLHHGARFLFAMNGISVARAVSDPEGVNFTAGQDFPPHFSEDEDFVILMSEEIKDRARGQTRCR